MIRRPLSRSLLGVIVTIAVVCSLLLTLSWTRIISSFDPHLRADFTEAGGLSSGDDVTISGIRIGKVTAVDLVGDHVRVTFAITDNPVRLGTETRAEIQAQTLLGKKGLVLMPAGPGRLKGEIPVSRTTAPYDVSDALSDLGHTTAELDPNSLKQAMLTLSTTLSSAAPNVGPALDGVLRLSNVINARNTELTELLKHSANLSGVLTDRRTQVQALLADGAQLLSVLNARSAAISGLLTHGAALAQQLSGLVADNTQQIGPALDKLNALLALLQDNKANIDAALLKAAPLVRELGGIVSAFPGFNVYVANLPPTNLAPGLPSSLTGNTP